MNIIDATVYGVQVPHCEGRAGMIALSLADEVDIDVCSFFFICLL